MQRSHAIRSVLHLGALAASVVTNDGTAAQAPQLLLDINTSQVPDRGSQPRHAARLGSWIYYIAAIPRTGRELFRTDGQVIELVVDLNPGTRGTTVTETESTGSALFLVVSDRTYGKELWVSDGTAAGTRIVKDIVEGGVGSNPSQLTASAGKVYFTAADGAGEELWVSDGTEAGTVRLADLEPGMASSTPRDLTPFRGGIAFRATTTNDGAEPYFSDGTAAGTVRLLDVWPGPIDSDPRDFSVLGNQLFFTAANPFVGREIWSSDGTPAGTTLFLDLWPGTAWSAPNPAAGTPRAMAVSGPQLFFAARDPASGLELWVSDGTPAGTRLAGDAWPGPTSGYKGGIAPMHDGRVLFAADDGSTGTEPWVSDGTPVGTFLLGDTAANGNARIGQLMGAPGRVFFTNTTATSGSEPWTSDGTVAGTRLLRDINPGVRSSLLFFQLVDPTSGALIFSADDPRVGDELWKSDGSPSGTSVLANTRAAPAGLTAPSHPTSFVRLFDCTLFTADSGSGVHELWRTDGTTGGTARLKSIAVASTSTAPLTVAGTNAYFLGNDPATGTELWASDGTAQGTRLVRDINPGPTLTILAELTAIGDRLFFLADDGVHGGELWMSDGTTAGTVLVKDILSGPASSSPLGLVALNGAVLFSATGGPETGNELWISDGTAAGTRLVTDVRPGFFSSRPRDLTTAGGAVFFRANDGISGEELWVTDGTAAGTRLVTDIVPGFSSSSPQHLVAVGGAVFFNAWESSTGLELWTSDGTAAGTRLVADLEPGAGSSNPTELTRLGGRIVFSAKTTAAGDELWASDGTAAGTTLIDLVSGAPSSAPSDFVAAGTRFAYFAATKGYGRDLWRTDGTAVGTTSLTTGGRERTEPSRLGQAGGQLLFSALHRVSGREPFVAQLGATSQPVGFACGAEARPALTSTDPVLGGVVQLRAEQAPPATVGFVIAGRLQPPALLSTQPGNRCALFVAAPTILTTAPVAPGTTSWQAAVPIPNAIALVGIEVAAQSIFAPTAAPLGADLSNGVALHLGR